MHNKISDLFQIRKKFDVSYILIPLSKAVEIPIDENYKNVLKTNRKTLMADVFYKYASSTNPQIDKHLIWIALDKWSWYWAFVTKGLYIFLNYFSYINFICYLMHFINKNLSEICKKSNRCNYIE
jgi:hypothetical protein